MANGSGVAYDRPEDWLFYVTPDQAAANVDPWPWTDANLSDVHQSLTFLADYRRIRDQINDNLLYSLIGIGTLGGILIVATVVSMPRHARSTFYKVMVAIAVFDVAFLMLKVARKRVVLLAPSALVTVLTFVSCGTVYTFSLLSDMLTLALTVERFVALSFPTFYKRLSRAVKRRAWLVAVLVSVLVSLSRSHYAFANTSYIIHAVADTEFFYDMSYFSDTIVPFLLAVLMILLVLGILRVIVRRLWTKANMGNAQQAGVSQRHLRESMKTMSLLSVLMVMFLVNQCGYVYYETAYMAYSDATVSFDASPSQVRSFVGLAFNFELANDISSLAEVASRSLIFYKYLIFSANFRNYFLQLCRLRAPDRGESTINVNNTATVSVVPGPGGSRMFGGGKTELASVD